MNILRCKISTVVPKIHTLSVYISYVNTYASSDGASLWIGPSSRDPKYHLFSISRYYANGIIFSIESPIGTYHSWRNL